MWLIKDFWNIYLNYDLPSTTRALVIAKVNSYTQQEFEDTDEENLLNQVKSLKLYFSLIGAALTKNILLLFIRELCILYLKLIREVHFLKMAL